MRRWVLVAGPCWWLSLLKGTALLKVNCIMMDQSGPSSLSSLPQLGTALKSHPSFKSHFEGKAHPPLYNPIPPHTHTHLLLLWKNPCLKGFWSVSHSPETVSERSHMGQSLNHLLGKKANKSETSFRWGERCPELSHADLIWGAIVKRSLWIRVLEAVEKNLQDGLWRERQDMGKLFRLSQPMVEI